jgi:hypothetical protein
MHPQEKRKGFSWSHLVNKFIDTNAIARGIKYEMPYNSKDNLTEYQYKILHTRKRPYNKGVRCNS